MFLQPNKNVRDDLTIKLSQVEVILVMYIATVLSIFVGVCIYVHT